jgi:hypothetical protein
MVSMRAAVDDRGVRRPPSNERPPVEHQLERPLDADEAGERLDILPIARPVILTAVLIAFLLNWKQWFPVVALFFATQRRVLSGFMAGAVKE